MHPSWNSCEIQICVDIASVSYLFKKIMVQDGEAHVKATPFTSERFKSSKIFSRKISLYLQ